MRRERFQKNRERETYAAALALLAALARRDFMRAALLGWITPDFVALSKTDAQVGVTDAIAAASPEAQAAFADLAIVFKRLFTERLRFAFVADLRMFFCADLMLAISVFSK